VARALDWSARLRAAGAAERCPLRAMVGDPALPAAERLRAAAALEGAFGEAQPDSAVAALVARLGDDERGPVTAELATLCPRLGRAAGARSPSPV